MSVRVIKKSRSARRTPSRMVGSPSPFLCRRKIAWCRAASLGLHERCFFRDALGWELFQPFPLALKFLGFVKEQASQRSRKQGGADFQLRDFPDRLPIRCKLRTI